jgi:hypothetical protein
MTTRSQAYKTNLSWEKNTGCSGRRVIWHWLTRAIETQNRAQILCNTRWRNTDCIADHEITELMPSICREIPMSADKMFRTSKMPAQWTLWLLVGVYCPYLWQMCCETGLSINIEVVIISGLFIWNPKQYCLFRHQSTTNYRRLMRVFLKT